MGGGYKPPSTQHRKKGEVEMAKINDKEKVNKARQQALEEENKILRQKLEDQQKLEQASQGVIGDRLSSEISNIRKKGRATGGTITVVSGTDYVPVTLWTKWGKPVGPQHPDNAIQTLMRFAEAGIILSATKPTNEQNIAWSNSPEGKAFWKKENERRAAKTKSRRAGNVEKVLTEIARLQGTTVEAIHHISRATEVKS